MKKNAECILKPTVVTLQCFSATLNLRLHSRLVWSQYRYQSAISLQRFCTSKCTHTHTVVFPAERKCIGHHYFVPERRRFHLDSASSLYSSFSFSNNTHAKSPAESFSSRFLSHIHSSILILDSPWPTYVLFPPPHTHTKFLHPRLLPSHVSHVSATLISSFYCCRCGNVDTKVLCCDTGIRTP